MFGCKGQHSHCQKSALQHAEEVCAQRGARFTDMRRKVFQILWETRQALTAKEVMEKLGNDQPPVTYRALDFLKDVGLIHHVTSLNAYVGCVCSDETHDGQFLICKECRQVQELVSPTVDEALHKQAAELGFQTDHVQVEILGLCAACDGAAVA